MRNVEFIDRVFRQPAQVEKAVSPSCFRHQTRAPAALTNPPLSELLDVEACGGVVVGCGGV